MPEPAIAKPVAVAREVTVNQDWTIVIEGIAKRDAPVPIKKEVRIPDTTVWV